jgi:hypothetical protein
MVSCPKGWGSPYPHLYPLFVGKAKEWQRMINKVFLAVAGFYEVFCSALEL